MKDQREKLEEEKKVFYEFGNVILGAARNIKIHRDDDGEHFRAESKAVTEIIQNSLMKGFLAGAISFVGLRWMRRGATRWFSRRDTRYDVRTHLDAKRFAEQRSHGKSPFHIDSQNLQGPAVKALHLTLDVVTSCAISILAMYQCFDLNKALPMLSRLPLMEGRSLVAEELCETIVNEMKKHPPEFWDGVQHPRMKAIAQLGWNCQRRWAYEKFLLNEAGNEPPNSALQIIVPPPGVSPVFPIDGETVDEGYSQYWFAKDGDEQGDLLNEFVTDSQVDQQ
jgi:hypothetical protein